MAVKKIRDCLDYEDRFVCVVMKDGTQIPLHTAGEGTQLLPDSPIVLSDVDYVLLGDGVKLEKKKQAQPGTFRLCLFVRRSKEQFPLK